MNSTWTDGCGHNNQSDCRAIDNLIALIANRQVTEKYMYYRQTVWWTYSARTAQKIAKASAQPEEALRPL